MWKKRVLIYDNWESSIIFHGRCLLLTKLFYTQLRKQQIKTVTSSQIVTSSHNFSCFLAMYKINCVCHVFPFSHTQKIVNMYSNKDRQFKLNTMDMPLHLLAFIRIHLFYNIYTFNFVAIQQRNLTIRWRFQATIALALTLFFRSFCPYDSIKPKW